MSMADNKKNGEMAARMKKEGIRRTTGTCPMGCGAQVKIGGSGLLNHFNICRGANR